MPRLPLALLSALTILLAIPCHGQWQQMTASNWGIGKGFLKSPDFLFAVTDRAILRSSNRGVSWGLASSGLPINVEIDPLHDFSQSGTRVFVGLRGDQSSTAGRLFASTNDGDSWGPLSIPPIGPGGGLLEALDYLDSTLFVSYLDRATFRSSDEGESWSYASGLPFPLGGVFDFISGWGKLFAGTTDGLYASTNKGVSWVRMANNGLPSPYNLISLAVLGSRLFAVTSTGTIVSSDNEGDNWSVRALPFGADPVYALSAADSALVAISHQGVWLSTDFALSWLLKNEGLPSGTWVTAFGVDGPAVFLYAENSLYGVFRRTLGELVGSEAPPHLQGVVDVPNDQGGQTHVLWLPSPFDVAPNQIVTEYRVWRGVRPEAAQPDRASFSVSQAPAFESMPAHPSTFYWKWPATPAGTDTIYWEYVGSNPAQHLSGYSFTAPTPSDSGPQGNSIYYFCVSAQTSNPSVFWISNVDSGYSVDNLAPAAPQTMAAGLIAGPAVSIRWKRNSSDPDVGSYEVYRDTVSGFTPSENTRVGQTMDTLLIDTGPTGGTYNYYRVLSVDVHGNKSIPSVQVEVAVCPTLRYDVAAGWNLVSVPLSVLDYSKVSVFPTATSGAFAYQGTYLVQTTLENGKGYWLKFGPPEQIPMAGFPKDIDTILVQQGWNLIGSTSSVVPLGSVTTVPTGIVVTPFYGYGPSGYVAVSSIMPAKAHWVKTNSSGVLVLSGSGRYTGVK